MAARGSELGARASLRRLFHLPSLASYQNHRGRTVQKLDLYESTSVSNQGLVHRKEYCGALRWTMRLAMDPFRLLLISLAGWLNQQQQDVNDYLQEENRVLREQLGGKRLRFNDDQRRRLAVRAKKLGCAS